MGIFPTLQPEASPFSPSIVISLWTMSFEIKELSKWIASLDDGRGKEKVALHLSRYFPRFKLDKPATDVGLIYRLRDVAKKELDHVFTGNC